MPLGKGKCISVRVGWSGCKEKVREDKMGIQGVLLCLRSHSVGRAQSECLTLLAQVQPLTRLVGVIHHLAIGSGGAATQKILTQQFSSAKALQGHRKQSPFGEEFDGGAHAFAAEHLTTGLAHL